MEEELKKIFRGDGKSGKRSSCIQEEWNLFTRCRMELDSEIGARKLGVGGLVEHGIESERIVF